MIKHILFMEKIKAGLYGKIFTDSYEELSDGGP
jgi:hypothetical protein